jgi:hypothetical protein
VKKLILILALFAFTSHQLLSQNAPISTIGIIASTGTTANVPITAINFKNIVSFYLTVDYDPSIVTCSSATINPILGGSLASGFSNPGIIVLSWFDYKADTLPDNSTFVTLAFTKVTGGTSALTFNVSNNSNCIWYNPGGSLNDIPKSTYYINGFVTFCTAGNWLGITGTNWNDANNWCTGIPTSATNVVIPSGGNQPVIGSAGGACNNITINGALTISGSNSLTVSGNWTNNGTFTGNTGTVTFNGSGTQTIGGSSGTTFYNVVTSGTTNTVTALATNISGNLSIGNGTTFATGGYYLPIGGNWTNSGTFNPGTGIVEFTGTNPSTIISGSPPGTNSFYNLKLSKTGGATWTVPSGTLITVNGVMTINQ